MLPAPKNPIEEISRITQAYEIGDAWLKYVASSHLPPGERIGLLHDVMQNLYYRTVRRFHTKETSGYEKLLIERAYDLVYEEYERFHQTLPQGDNRDIVLCIGVYSNLLVNALAIRKEEERLERENRLPISNPNIKKELYIAGGSAGYSLLYWTFKNSMGSFLKETFSSNTRSTLSFLGTTSLVISSAAFLVSACSAIRKCKPVVKNYGIAGLFSSKKMQILLNERLEFLKQEREKLLALVKCFEEKTVFQRPKF